MCECIESQRRYKEKHMSKQIDKHFMLEHPYDAGYQLAALPVGDDEFDKAPEDYFKIVDLTKEQQQRFRLGWYDSLMDQRGQLVAERDAQLEKIAREAARYGDPAN